LLLFDILGVLILLYVFYTCIPELLFKYLHLGTIYKGPATVRQIALTFDDGPDPRYTPHVLNILKEYNAKATFFLVGKRAQAHPDLVQQILADGHEVASHGFAHRHAWLLHPVATWQDIAVAKQTLETLTGQRLAWYRPPWGAFNLATRIACARLGLKPVLWSRRAIDWLPGEYASEVVQRVVGGAHTGAIVLCHDAGGAEGAPLNTIRALPEILAKLGALGYTFVTVGDLQRAAAEQRAVLHNLFGHYPWPRRLLIAIWNAVEWVFSKLYRVENVNRIFRIAPIVWRHGCRLDEQGSVVVEDSAKAIDLHFQNETLITLSGANDPRALVKGLRMAKDGFRDLARILQSDPKYQDVQVACAMTLMNRGLEMMGFHVEDLPDTFEKRRLQWYMRFLMGLYHPEGFSRLKQGRQPLELKLVWMTKEEIIQRYGG
jgi:peptidoglycan/xylan/chitin deacetylase (PgdA/CDA1 family)